MNKIMVVNAGSSTIKWKLFEKENFLLVAEGIADRISVDGTIQTKFGDLKRKRNIPLKDHEYACQEIVKDLQDLKILKDVSEVVNLGYRVVQGGDLFRETIILSPKKIDQIAELSTLAPLHNPGAVAAMRAFSLVFKRAQGSATFDTAFHSTIPCENAIYPINQKLTKDLKIKKYGAHGISHQFITKKLAEILQKPTVNFVNLHIGNGASLCAVKNSLSIDTSMGLTPLAGVMMGTRSGDIDPSIHSYVMRKSKMSIGEFENILNKESGLKGVSGVSQDMRDVLLASQNGNKQASLAILLYTQKIADFTVNYLNKVGPNVDALVFTAGVGENAHQIRQMVVDKIKIVKLEIDKEKNEMKTNTYQLISSLKSSIPIYVIRTNEELMIAQEAVRAANGS